MKKYSTEFGEKTIPELIEITGLHKATIFNRMKHGKPLADKIQNGRAHSKIEHNGEKLTVTQWVQRATAQGLTSHHFYYRRCAGWSMARILSEDVRTQSKTERKNSDLPPKIKQADKQVEKNIGYSPTAIHINRLLAQGISKHDIKKRMAGV